MKHFVFCIGMLLASGMALNAKAQEKDCFRIVNDSYEELRLEIELGEPVVGTTTICGQTFSTLTIDGLMPWGANGAPALPTFSRLIEVPLCSDFDIITVGMEYDTLQLQGPVLAPMQPSRSKSDMTTPKLSYTRGIYETDMFFGGTANTVEAVGIARDRRLARLQLCPVSYNPVSGQVAVMRHAEVTVRYRGADKEGTLAMFERYHSPAFASGSQVINDLYPKAVRTTAPVRYLIVANSMFRGQFDSFIQWKRRKGFLVDIVYTDNTAVGTTTTSIQSYLQSQYTNATTANPAPTYVLLVGDVAQLPAFDAQITSPSDDHVTDLYYMTWTSGDHIPDCHYGRFSAQTVAQLTPQIQKTLMYEQYTFADPSFLDRAVLVAGVDGGNSGDYGYTHADPAMDYAVTNYVNGTHGFSNVYYFKNNTSIIPSCTTNVTIASSANNNSATVRAYYNLGAGLINYSAHGSATSWGTPNFTTTHVASMTNTQKFGLMIGNCCLTNRFNESTCFGESLLRKDNYCGAVGYIGGSNSTYWYEDFYWAVGVRSSIGPSMSMAYNSANLGVYDRVFHTHNEAYSNWAITQGAIMMQGNMAVESSTSNSSYKHYYWEIYHLMGDPSVMPYMTQADTMTVTVASVVTLGTTSLAVTAAPNAYVALVDTVTWTLLASAYANTSGTVTLTLPADLAVGTYQLAASAQQYRTSFRNIRVIQPDGAFPLVTAVTPATLTAGDTVLLSLHIENPGNQTAHNVVVSFSVDNATLSLSSPSITLDSVPAGGSVDLANVLSAYVADNVADNSATILAFSTSWNGSTINATGALRLQVYAPMLTITFSDDNPSLLPGASSTLTATLHNSGHAATRSGSLVFSSPTALLAVSSSPSAPFVLQPDGSATVTLSLQASNSIPQNIYVPVAYSLNSFSGTMPLFIGGAFTETFEGGTTHFDGWNPPAAYPWSVSTEQPYEGSYCLRSVQYMDHSQQSDMSINVTVTQPDSVKFYYRVSSENNYDKFHFLVDSVSQFNASGEVEWTFAAVPLSVGTHVLTFRYAKDYSISNGSDCAWIDNVVLPHQINAATFVHRDVCQGEPLTASGHTLPTQQAGDTTVILTATNGSLTIVDYTVHPASNAATEIIGCDSVLWNDAVYTQSVLTVDTLQNLYGCDSIVGINLVVNHSSVGDTLVASTMATTYEWYGTVYSASGTYSQVFTNAEGCDSIIVLQLTIGPENVGIADENMANPIVYPNPTSHLLHFSVPVDEAVLFDALGREVLRTHHVQSLDLGSLPQGVYTLSVGEYKVRVVKQ